MEDGTARAPTGAAGAIGQWLGAWVSGSRTRAAVTVALALLVALAAGSYARGIRINTNLEALLADNAPSVEALAELRTRQGPTDLLNIAVQSDDPVANRRLVEDIYARIKTWPEVNDAFIELDYTPMRDRALYFLDKTELEDLHERLKNERRRVVAGTFSVSGDKIDPTKVLADDDWDEEDWEEGGTDADDEAPAEPAQPDADDDVEPAKSIREVLQDSRDNIAASGRIRETDLDLIWPKENDKGEMIWEETVRKSVSAPDGKIMLVRARLLEPPTNLEFATGVTTKVDALFEELRVEDYAPGMLAKVGGAYGSSGEAKSIIKDLRASTWLSGGLVLCVLLAGFRSPRAVAVVLIPLVSSVMVTVAMARLLLGELNVLTAFLFAVLLGIGVDFAVHLYAQRERQGPVADWGNVFGHHLRPLTASMLTTMGSFLVLTIADFRGFQEFGLIAAVGVFVAFIAAIVMVPALDTLLGAPQNRRWSEGSAQPSSARLQAPKIRIALLLAAGALGVIGAPRVQFERDMRELRAPKSSGEKGIAYQRALKATQDTGTPVVLLADSNAQLNAAVEILEAHKDADTDILAGTERSWIKSVYSLDTHMPSEQESKVAVLAGLAETAAEIRASGSADEYDSHLDTLERLARAKPLGEDEIPLWAKQLFQERNGDVGNIGLIYTQVQGYDLEQVVFVTKRFSELMAEPGVRGASTRFILGDLTIAVEEDTQRLPPYALAIIALLIALDLRRFWPAVITFATLCLGLLLTFGVMGVWPIRINFYNLVVMPAVVGLGIDASIHLWHARKSSAVGATSKAALVSALTTAGGFSGLIISEHGGLRSIGLLGVTATLCCVLIAIVALGWPRARSGPTP